jgi:hypothetical protein
MAQQARKGKIVVIDGASHGLGRKARNYRGTDSFVSIAAGSEFTAWDGVSCLVYEPILGANGANGSVPVPLPWLRGLSQSAQEAGVTVIADEIQCGFFRFGKLSLAMSEYLHPDMYLFGNSMTNGIYPLSAVVCPKTLDGGVLAGDGGGDLTFQTATLGYQAAECVAKYIDSTDIEGQVSRFIWSWARLGRGWRQIRVCPAFIWLGLRFRWRCSTGGRWIWCMHAKSDVCWWEWEEAACVWLRLRRFRWSN